jgi:co-chaperonin GroES (HSP10)
MKIIGPRVLVKRIEIPKTESLIELVEYNPQPSQYAIVLGVGSWITSRGDRVSLDGINIGDTVLLRDYSGAPMPSFTAPDGTRFEAVMVMEDDVLAIIES